MKLLFYIANVEHEGGAERVLSIVANGLCKKGYDIVLVNDFPTTKKEYFLESTVKRLYLENKVSEGRIKRNINRVRGLGKFIRNEKPDVVVSFLLYQNIRLLISSLFFKCTKILSVRNDPQKDIGEGKIVKLVINALYGMADGIVFQTEEEKEYFSIKIQKKSTVILNPIDDLFYEAERNQKVQNIIAVGRLEKQKNHKLLIEAYMRIREKFPDDKLYIYGCGDLEQELEQIIDENGLEKDVFLKGRVSNIVEKMKSAKLFVLSSDYEGLPNALMEAMAVGTPAISTDCSGGGPRMLISNEKEGKLVECNNVDQLAEALEECLSNQETLKRYSINSKKRAEEFRKDNIINQWDKFIIDTTMIS